MQYETPVANDIIMRTAKALAAHGFETIIADSKQEALQLLVGYIPAGASVMSGASKTLKEIGFTRHLESSQHSWRDLHKEITAEHDERRRAELRRQAVLADFYLGSAHAVSEAGEILVASNTGSQLPPLAFTAHNVILVIGTQKIVPSLDEAFIRLHQHVIPLEDRNMMEQYGTGTMLSKVLILFRENPMMGRKVRVMFVKEKVGF